MNRSTLIFLLGLSLLFNIFFVAGAMTWRVPAESDETQEVADIARKLDLDEQQKQAFLSMRRQFETESAVIREQLLRMRDRISQELESETPNVEQLRYLSAQESALLAERRTIGVDQFTFFVDMLSPNQRRDLGRRLSGHPRGRRGSPEEIERRAVEMFDLNGDGILDESERQNAREFAKQEHEQRRLRREKTRMQFDLNGDGSLSPEEHEAYRKHILENRESHHRNRPPHDRPPHDRPPHDRPPRERRGDGPPPPGGQF